MWVSPHPLFLEECRPLALRLVHTSRDLESGESRDPITLLIGSLAAAAVVVPDRLLGVGVGVG